MGKVTSFLLVLLVISVGFNIYLVQNQNSDTISALQDRITSLEEQNRHLTMELYQTNLSLQQARRQLSFYRDEIAELKSKISANNVPGEVGTARLDAPAVLRRVEYSGEFPFMTQQIIEEGTMMEVTVEIKPGKGRVLVETEPLMGVVFQDAANNAVAAAENYLGCDLSGSDVIFSVEAEAEVPEVDGPSAGALMTTLVVAAVENITLPEDITMTGTISPDGHVGEIGGVIEKAKASKAAGKRILMLPEENAHIVRYEAVKKQYGGLTVITQKPVIIDTEEYIEENVGIDVVYVDSLKEIFDVING
ncbi:MAG: archaeal serine protease [Candidatus Syntrophoarchaeum caldarius]|uniref:Archaeal serine protease n=1 Tax=Candidatus Syntropharchaeum caldarium TaxID=1838285 RepID=A0A1F2PBI5_9EURY|nr:MAG: archaeal serine protease [Candidatus Syntrophoarchaeum caldarius]